MRVDSVRVCAGDRPCDGDEKGGKKKGGDGRGGNAKGDCWAKTKRCFTKRGEDQLASHGVVNLAQSAVHHVVRGGHQHKLFVAKRCRLVRKNPSEGRGGEGRGDRGGSGKTRNYGGGFCCCCSAAAVRAETKTQQHGGPRLVVSPSTVRIPAPGEKKEN